MYAQLENSLLLLSFLNFATLYFISLREIRILQTRWFPLITFIIGSFFFAFYPVLWEKGEGHPPLPPLIFFIPIYLLISFIPVIISIMFNKGKKDLI